MKRFQVTFHYLSGRKTEKITVHAENKKAAWIKAARDLPSEIAKQIDIMQTETKQVTE